MHVVTHEIKFNNFCFTSFFGALICTTTMTNNNNKRYWKSNFKTYLNHQQNKKQCDSSKTKYFLHFVYNKNINRRKLLKQQKQKQQQQILPSIHSSTIAAIIERKRPCVGFFILLINSLQMHATKCVCTWASIWNINNKCYQSIKQQLSIVRGVKGGGGSRERVVAVENLLKLIKQGTLLSTTIDRFLCLWWTLHIFIQTYIPTSVYACTYSSVWTYSVHISRALQFINFVFLFAPTREFFE